jgi:hypothetical protein
MLVSCRYGRTATAKSGQGRARGGRVWPRERNCERRFIDGDGIAAYRIPVARQSCNGLQSHTTVDPFFQSKDIRNDTK